MEGVELKLKEILGRSALANFMQVPEDVKMLAQATRYLATQLILTHKGDPNAKEDIIDPVFKQVIDILTK